MLFLEVTEGNGSKRMVNFAHVTDVFPKDVKAEGVEAHTRIFTLGEGQIDVQESYEHLKELIEYAAARELRE